MAEAVRLGEEFARPKRAQPQCRLRHRLRRRQDRRPRRDRGRRPAPCRGHCARSSRAAGKGCDRLCHARALRPCQRARARLRRIADQGQTGEGGDCAQGSGPADGGQGHQAAAGGGDRGHGRRCSGGRKAVGIRLAHADSDGPPARDSQARFVDRRQDRASLGRIEMDHRRGCAPPRSSRALPVGHDPGRPRHIFGGRPDARRSPARARGALAETRAADPRRSGRRLGSA